jgi:hypothetical protein
VCIIACIRPTSSIACFLYPCALQKQQAAGLNARRLLHAFR